MAKRRYITRLEGKAPKEETTALEFGLRLDGYSECGYSDCSECQEDPADVDVFCNGRLVGYFMVRDGKMMLMLADLTGSGIEDDFHLDEFGQVKVKERTR